MAKLKARGRKEIFRVLKTVVPDPGSPRSGEIEEVRHYRAFTTDGNVLERMVIYYTREETRKNYGKRLHDYGWKVKGRARAGKTLEELLKSYLEKGWELEEANPAYFRVGPGFVEGISQEPFISEKKAEKRRASIAKSRERASEERERRNGPGFYVTNNLVGSGYLASRPRVADHPEPFQTFEEAEEWAVGRMRHLLSMRLDYLLPVEVVEADSRSRAEGGHGHAWWVNGKYRGPAVDPRQEAFPFTRSQVTIDRGGR